MAVAGDIEFGRDSAIAPVLLAYVGNQVRVLIEQEPLVRKGVPDSVHQMRVVTRRLRSVFATYGALLDIDFVGHMRDELKWLGLVLGAERDAEVMRQRFTDLIASEPTEMDFKSVSRQLDEQLSANLSAAHQVVLGTLGNERYFQLLNDLKALLAEPPLTHLAAKPIKKIVPELIREDLNRLIRAVTGLKETQGNSESALHEVRKRAKRLRYAAETAELAHYKGANKMANAAAEVQTILGDYHDSVVARDLLHCIGEQSAPRKADAFILEHLAALEERNAEISESQFRKAWKHFPSFRRLTK